MKGRRLKELAALFLIGDGVLSAVSPKRHTLLWRGGPKWFVRCSNSMARRPQLTRIAGVASTAAGLYWASRQHPRTSFWSLRS